MDAHQTQPIDIERQTIQICHPPPNHNLLASDGPLRLGLSESDEVYVNTPLPLFDHALARTSDPQTSKDAAASVASFGSRHSRIIYEALKAHGPMSKTRLSKVTGLDHVAIGKRLPDLERGGWALPTDETELSASGRRERKWRIK